MAEQPVQPAEPQQAPAPAPPMTVEQWRAQVQAAKDKRKPYEKDWQELVQKYLGKPLSTTPVKDTIIVPKDFANVEQKKAQLFSQLPELHIEPTRNEFAVAAPVVQAVMRDLLGPRQVNAQATMDECTFDALCPAGLLCSKIGYENVIKGLVAMPTGQVDPLTGPVTRPVPNVVYERYFWERVSPLKILIPPDFHGSDYDKAPWLGIEFELDATVAERTLGVTDGAYKKDPTDEGGLNTSEPLDAPTSLGGARPKVCGAEIWYRASHFDPLVSSPEVFRRVLLIDGRDELMESPSPYQVLGPDGTVFAGLKRNPIRIGALRYVSDSAYPPSDCAMSQPQVEELSKGRTQMIQQRDRSLPMRAVNRGLVAPDTVEKLEKGQLQEIIFVDAPPQDVIAEISRAQFPRENFEFDRIVNRDLSEVWALGSAQRGVESDSARTATELSLIQSNTDVRLRRERGRVLDYYIRASECLFALVQLFATDDDYVRVVGADGVAKLQTWNKNVVAGEFAFSAKPDSAVFQDQAMQRKRATEVFQFLAPSPVVNQQELMTWFLQQQDMEPAKFIAPPKPPEPEKPKVSFSFKGEDLNPMAPQFAIVSEIMQQAGFRISPQAIANATGTAAMGALLAPPEKGHQEPNQTGTAPQQGPLNKHQSDETGRLTSGLAPAVQ